MDIREEYIDEQEMRNSFNQKILDSIIDDNNDEFSKLISQKNIYNSIINQSFWMSNYKIPDILHGSPTYASLCAFFGSEKCFQALLTVIPEGIESNQLTKRDAYGRTPFHFACAGGNMSIIRELHTAGFRIDQHDYDGKSPCHFSAITGKIDALKYLWSKGVDILSCTDRDFYTPLQMACLYGNVEIVKFICEEVCTDLEELEMNIDRLEFDYRCRFGCSPTKTGNLLHLACQNGNSVVLNYLLSNQKKMTKKWIKTLDNKSRLPLHVACQNGSFECVKLLVNNENYKPDLNGRKHIAIIDAAANGYTDIVLFLLKKGVDINITNSVKFTALDEAILDEHIDVVKLLIDHGATKDFDDEKIANLFTKACSTLNKEIYSFFDQKFIIPYNKYGNEFIGKAVQLENEELVNYLLDKKCTLDNIGSYVTFSSKWKPFMNFLKEKGVTFSEMESKTGIPLIVKSIKGGSYDSVKQMIKEGATITKEIIDQYDCIMMTCERGSRKLFNFLLKHNPDMSKSDLYLENLLNKYNEYRDRLKETKMKDRLKMADTLLSQYHANPNQIKIICEAANRCAMNVLNIFAKYSANFNLCPFDYTTMIKREHLTVFKFLESNGCLFARAKTGLYVLLMNCPLDRSIRENDSPLEINLRFIFDSDHDIETTVFLVKFTSIKVLLSISINDGNLIDVFLDKGCFDGILAVYQRIGFAVLPKKTERDVFKKIINANNNQQLMSFMEQINV